MLYARKCSVKPVFNDHLWDPSKVAVVERWSLFRGHLCNKSYNWDLKMVVIVDRWSLAQVWLYSYAQENVGKIKPWTFKGIQVCLGDACSHLLMSISNFHSIISVQVSVLLQPDKAGTNLFRDLKIWFYFTLNRPSTTTTATTRATTTTISSNDFEWTNYPSRVFPISKPVFALVFSIFLLIWLLRFVVEKWFALELLWSLVSLTKQQANVVLLCHHLS